MSKNENPGGPGTPLPGAALPPLQTRGPAWGQLPTGARPPPDSGYSPPAHTKTRPPAAARSHPRPP